MQVQLESPNQPDIILLIEALDDYQDSLYPAEARYALDLNTLELCSLIFAVARSDAGVAVGCGTLVLSGRAAELKRMFVSPSCRGQGVAAKVLVKLEAEATKRGCQLVQLETGPLQPEALAFYQKYGFQLCGAFGDYAAHPLSVFMEKKLNSVPIAGLTE
jgi:putative acetyltransferase